MIKTFLARKPSKHIFFPPDKYLLSSEMFKVHIKYFIETRTSASLVERIHEITRRVTPKIVFAEHLLNITAYVRTVTSLALLYPGVSLDIILLSHLTKKKRTVRQPAV